MRTTIIRLAGISGIALAVAAIAPGTVSARQAVGATPSANETPLAPLPRGALEGAFHYSASDRPSGEQPHVLSAFILPKFGRATIMEAQALGYLPVTLRLSDGTCRKYTADWQNYSLANGRLGTVACPEHHGQADDPSQKPDRAGLRFVDSSWGMEAWVDDKSGVTIITKPFAKTFTPLMTLDFPVSAMMAMIDPHGVGANITLIGKPKGTLAVITIDASVL